MGKGRSAGQPKAEHIMKHLITLLIAGSMTLHAWEGRAASGLSELEALSLIETGGNDRVVGDAGEVSRYQILPVVWKRYTKSREFQNRGVASQVAARHLGLLRRSYEEEVKRPPTDFDLYVMWNAGFAYYRKLGFVPRRVHAVVRDRAERFANLRQWKPSQGRGDTVTMVE